MNDFFQSKFIKDLEAGELPEVKIVLPPDTLFNIGLTAFLVTIAIMLSAQIFKSIAN